MTMVSLRRCQAQPTSHARSRSATTVSPAASNVYALHAANSRISAPAPIRRVNRRHVALLAIAILATVGLPICGWLSLNSRFGRVAMILDQKQHEPVRALDALRLDMLRVDALLDRFAAEVDRLDGMYEAPADGGSRMASPPMDEMRPSVPPASGIRGSGS